MTLAGSADASTENLERIVRAACRTAASGPEVRSVRVTSGHRPSYGALARCRHLANVCGVEMTLDGDGTITLRPRAPVRPPAPVRAARAWGETWHRLARLGPAWVTTEGVR